MTKKNQTIKPVMTTESKYWQDFCYKLSGKEGCDFTEESWKCNNDHTFTRAILAKYYPEFDVDATIRYFESNGGYCDCEVLFNVDKEL